MTQIQQKGVGTMVPVTGGEGREVRYVIWAGGAIIHGRLSPLAEPSPSGFDFFDETGSNLDFELTLDNGRKMTLGALQADGRFRGAAFIK